MNNLPLCSMSNTHTRLQGVLLDLDQEISGMAVTQNKNKNNYALTFEK